MTIYKLHIVHETAVYRNTHICTVLLETEKLVKSLIDQQLNMFCFFRKHKEEQPL